MFGGPPKIARGPRALPKPAVAPQFQLRDKKMKAGSKRGRVLKNSLAFKFSSSANG